MGRWVDGWVASKILRQPPGVEQTFTKIMQSLGAAENANDSLFSAYCKLAADARGLTRNAEAELCKDAQVVWIEFAGIRDSSHHLPHHH